jgi:hypothetical protein
MKEGEKGREDEQEDASTYWMTLREREDSRNLKRRNTGPQSVQNSLWTCITGHVKTTAEVF